MVLRRTAKVTFPYWKLLFLSSIFKQLLLKNCAMDFLEICNVCTRKVIIKAAKRLFNSDKICVSYCDFYCGVTVFGTHCTCKWQMRWVQWSNLLCYVSRTESAPTQLVCNVHRLSKPRQISKKNQLFFYRWASPITFPLLHRLLSSLCDVLY